jgi:hypothetical protein
MVSGRVDFVQTYPVAIPTESSVLQTYVSQLLDAANNCAPHNSRPGLLRPAKLHHHSLLLQHLGYLSLEIFGFTIPTDKEQVLSALSETVIHVRRAKLLPSGGCGAVLEFYECDL